MHFLIGLGILAGLVWFAFGAGAARAIVGVALLGSQLLRFYPLCRRRRYSPPVGGDRTAGGGANPNVLGTALGLRCTDRVRAGGGKRPEARRRPCRNQPHG